MIEELKESIKYNPIMRKIHNKVLRVTHTDYFLLKHRGIEIGDILDVLDEGISCDKKARKFYLVEKNNNPIVLYDDEVSVMFN